MAIGLWAGLSSPAASRPLPRRLQLASDLAAAPRRARAFLLTRFLTGLRF